MPKQNDDNYELSNQQLPNDGDYYPYNIVLSRVFQEPPCP